MKTYDSLVLSSKERTYRYIELTIFTELITKREKITIMMPNSRSGIFIMILAAAGIVVAVYFLFFYNPAPGVGPENLVGTWERTDYPYMIEVRSFDEDGSLDATYLNPQPINVGTAKWEVYEDKLYMYVEMQDVNYPGSNYTLVYEEQPEKLSGTYFQAVSKESFTVAFTRTK